MKSEINRRELLALSAVGATGLILSPKLAFANTNEKKNEIGSTALSINEFKTTGDEDQEEHNHEVLRLWDEAVKKAEKEGSEIITIKNTSEKNIIVGWEDCFEEGSRAPKVIGATSFGKWVGPLYTIVGVTAKYETSGNQITTVEVPIHVGTLAGIPSASLANGGYSFTRLDGGKTIAFYFCVYYSFPLGGAYYDHYAEFYASGSGWAY